MKSINISDAAYLAGLFDGEGTFTITTLKTAKYPKYYFVEVYLTNTNKGIMDWLSTILDGKACITRHSDKGKNWKDVYKFNVHAKDKEVFIKKIYLYLRIKKEQARLALELLSMIREQKASKRGIGGLSLQEREARQQIAISIVSFNKRGLSKTASVND